MGPCYGAIIVRKLTEEDLKVIESDEGQKSPEIKYPLVGPFYKVEELKDWTREMWEKMCKELGVFESSRYALDVFKVTDNKGTTVTKYYGDLSSFVNFSDDTIEYLIYESVDYMFED